MARAHVSPFTPARATRGNWRSSSGVQLVSPLVAQHLVDAASSSSSLATATKKPAANDERPALGLVCEIGPEAQMVLDSPRINAPSADDMKADWLRGERTDSCYWKWSKRYGVVECCMYETGTDDRENDQRGPQLWIFKRIDSDNKKHMYIATPSDILDWFIPAWTRHLRVS